MDDALLKSLGDEAVGVISAAYYSAAFGTESNKRFVAAMQKDYGVLPGGYSAGMYVAGQCVEAAIQALGGKADDRKAFAEALHKVSLTDTPRGAVKFDQYGNVVGDVFIRKLRAEGRPARQHGDQDLSRTSASSGPTTRRSSWRTRSTRATIRRPRTWRTEPIGMPRAESGHTLRWRSSAAGAGDPCLR